MIRKIFFFSAILVLSFFTFKFSGDFKFYLLQIKAYYDLRPVVQDLDEVSKNQIGQVIDLGTIGYSEDDLFFRYSELNCKVCVDETFEILLDSTTNRKNIYLLIDFSNSRYLQLLLKRNRFNSQNVIFVEKGKIFPDVDAINQPYIFTVSKDGKVQSFFIVMNEFPSRTRRYVSSIER